MDTLEVTNTEPSISDLRAMIAPEPEAAPATPAAEAAPAATEAKTAPASEPDKSQEPPEGMMRDASGKFVAKPKEPKEDTLIQPTDPPGVQKRIGQALQREREAKEALARMQAQGSQPAAEPGSKPAAEPAKPAAAAAPPATATDAAKAPKAEDFATYEEYTAELTRFVTRQEIAAEVKRQTDIAVEKARATEAAKRQTDFNASEDAYRALVPDYDDHAAAFFEKLPNSPAGRDIADYILATQNPALMAALGKDPAELARIAGTSPNRDVLVRELARFEAKIPQAAAPAKPAASPKPLPKPAANAGGGASAKAADLNDPDIDFGTFTRLFKAGLSAD